MLRLENHAQELPLLDSRRWALPRLPTRSSLTVAPHSCTHPNHAPRSGQATLPLPLSSFVLFAQSFSRSITQVVETHGPRSLPSWNVDDSRCNVRSLHHHEHLAARCIVRLHEFTAPLAPLERPDDQWNSTHARSMSRQRLSSAYSEARQGPPAVPSRRTLRAHLSAIPRNRSRGSRRAEISPRSPPYVFSFFIPLFFGFFLHLLSFLFATFSLSRPPHSHAIWCLYVPAILPSGPEVFTFFFSPLFFSGF